MTTTEAYEAKEALEMYTVANEFCIFTENISEYKSKSILLFYSRILPLLYVKGSLLKNIDYDENFPSERFVTEEIWENVFETVKNKLSDDDIFYASYDFNTDLTETKSSIAENIADIYQDLKDFTIQFSEGLVYQKNNAVSDCKTLFTNHWGNRICLLMPALHDKIYTTSENNYY
ncbi:MAG: DUF5063 domain-containing protein [Bacteroidales bacterium]|jgi:hypothetical protein